MSKEIKLIGGLGFFFDGALEEVLACGWAAINGRLVVDTKILETATTIGSRWTAFSKIGTASS